MATGAIALTEENIRKYDLNDLDYKRELRMECKRASAEEMRGIIARAKLNTEKQLMAGEDCTCEYTLEAFTRERSAYGDSDYSPDGIHIFVEQLPSSIAPWRSYAGRLKRKFGLDEKTAQAAAVMVNYVGDGTWPVKRWFEGYSSKAGFKKAFGHVRMLFWKLYSLEPHDGERRASNIAEFIEEHIGEGHAFRALPIAIDEMAEAEEEAKRVPDAKTENYRMFHDMIRRAGTHQISNIGSKLYNANNNGWFYYEDATALFAFYRDRKEYLYENFGKYQKKGAANNN